MVLVNSILDRYERVCAADQMIHGPAGRSAQEGKGGVQRPVGCLGLLDVGDQQGELGRLCLRTTPNSSRRRGVDAVRLATTKTRFADDRCMVDLLRLAVIVAATLPPAHAPDKLSPPRSADSSPRGRTTAIAGGRVGCRRPRREAGFRAAARRRLTRKPSSLVSPARFAWQRRCRSCLEGAAPPTLAWLLVALLLIAHSASGAVVLAVVNRGSLVPMQNARPPSGTVLLRLVRDERLERSERARSRPVSESAHIVESRHIERPLYLVRQRGCVRHPEAVGRRPLPPFAEAGRPDQQSVR